MAELTPELGKQLGKILTDQCPAAVFAMAKRVGTVPSGHKISSCTLKMVTKDGCEISYVTCRGDACAMPKTATYTFSPPLQVNDPKFMDNLHNQACAPKMHWLVSKPLALFVLLTCSVLSYATLYLGYHGMIELLAEAPNLENGVSTVFGSTRNFAVIVIVAWCFAVFVHCIEAGMAYQYCGYPLRLRNEVSSRWAMLVFVVGWPVLSEIYELIEAQERDTKTK